MKELKNYQEEAVDKLIKRSLDFLNEKGAETIVFQAPTGSGKTFMATKYMDELMQISEDDLCFVWVSIGKGELHKQSYKSVQREISSAVECSVLEEDFFGSRNSISQNEIVFLNWEKIRSKNSKTGDWKNTAMKDKETINFIEVLENTRETGRKIVLIIDESHASAKSDRAIEIRDEIVKPEITIEMSATPVLKNTDTKITVDPTDVIKEGMIKKEVLINPDIDIIVDDEIDSQELILQAAVLKREELAKQYRESNSKVNPLVLIQLPNADAGEDKKNAIISFLREKNITEENGKVAIWLSDEKINNDSDQLLTMDGKVEYLIFKQAIDTGWDCPRAQILVKFRETNSIVFEIQTVGRILRMPESRHYMKDSLNSSYVYTNIQSINVKKEIYNPNIIKTCYSKRKANYKDIQLTSYYKQRTDFGDVTSSFYGSYEKYFCDFFDIKMADTPDYYENMEKLKEKNVHIDFFKMDQIINNKTVKTTEIDNSNKEITGNMISVNFNEIDLQYQFENIIKANLNGFSPRRSISTVKQATFYAFKKYLNLTTAKGGTIYMQNLVVRNESVFSVIYDRALKAYKHVHESEVNAKSEEKYNLSFEIPISKNYNPETTTLLESKLSIMEPLYILKDRNGKINELEKEFIEYMDKHEDKIDWFWQNGAEHMESNFGIKVDDRKTFQPDFLVSFKDGRIGIFDTKASGYNEIDNRLKSNALQKYIEEQRNKGKNLIGGIVIKDGAHFRVNQNIEYNSYNEAESEWDYFDKLLA